MGAGGASGRAGRGRTHVSSMRVARVHESGAPGVFRKMAALVEAAECAWLCILPRTDSREESVREREREESVRGKEESVREPERGRDAPGDRILSLSHRILSLAPNPLSLAPNPPTFPAWTAKTPPQACVRACAHACTCVRETLIHESDTVWVSLRVSLSLSLSLPSSLPPSLLFSHMCLGC